MSESKFAEKIAALLAKAEGTDNEHEREAFMQAAEKLSVKWGISDAMAADAAARKSGKPAESVVKQTLVIKDIYRQGWVLAATSVSAGIGGIHLVQSQHGSGPITLHVIGHESDTKRFVQLFESLMVQGDMALYTWWKPRRGTVEKAEGFRMRRQFIIAFGVTVGERLREERKRQTEETTGAELVLVNRDALVKQEVSRFFPKLRTARSNIAHGGFAASAAGRAAGQRADLGGKRAVQG